MESVLSGQGVPRLVPEDPNRRAEYRLPEPVSPLYLADRQG